VLDEHEPGHTGSLEQLRADLKGGFPWHRAADAHPELSEPEAWWASLNPLLARTFAGAGVRPSATVSWPGPSGHASRRVSVRGA
jgi:hypothetical protein